MTLTPEQAATAGLTIIQARAVLAAPACALPTPYGEVNAMWSSLLDMGLIEPDPTPGSSWKYRLTGAGIFKHMQLTELERSNA